MMHAGARLFLQLEFAMQAKSRWLHFSIKILAFKLNVMIIVTCWAKTSLVHTTIKSILLHSLIATFIRYLSTQFPLAEINWSAFSDGSSVTLYSHIWGSGTYRSTNWMEWTWNQPHSWIDVCLTLCGGLGPLWPLLSSFYPTPTLHPLTCSLSMLCLKFVHTWKNQLKMLKIRPSWLLRFAVWINRDSQLFWW